jgi:protein TonB
MMPTKVHIAVICCGLLACVALVAGDATINISDKTNQPTKLVHMVKPQYPPEAKEARIQGLVRLNVQVAKDGTVEKIEVLEGHPKLADAAVEAVRQWVYEPVKVDGQPVTFKVDVDVNFTLSE